MLKHQKQLTNVSNTRYRNTVIDLYKKGSKPTERSIYKAISDSFFELLSKDLIDNGVAIKLPHRLGTLQVRKKINDKKKKVVDFYRSKLYGTKLYHHNRHSDGYYAFLNWDKTMPAASFSNKSLFKVSFTRANKRYMSKQIKNNLAINKYFEIC